MRKMNKDKSSPDPNVLANLCLKVNFKLAGTNHRLDKNPDWYGALPATMIVRADVTHPRKNQDCPSLASVVATCDKDSAYYLASVRLQSGNQEHIQELDEMILERLKVFYQKNEKRLLQHILIYRDGVGESQFGMVLEKEVPLIQSACSKAQHVVKAGNTPEIKITLIIVRKRHHTRFFPDPILNSNLYSGLVVDNIVTSPMKCDFYLQSHDSALGTTRSAYYIIVLNESGYAIDALQELASKCSTTKHSLKRSCWFNNTNKICYTGSRAAKALSFCMPARYGDLLCDRLRCYMKNSLDTRMPLSAAGVPVPTRIATHQANLDTWGYNNVANLPDTPNMSQSEIGWRQARPASRVLPWHPNCDEFMLYL